MPRNGLEVTMSILICGSVCSRGSFGNSISFIISICFSFSISYINDGGSSSLSAKDSFSSLKQQLNDLQNQGGLWIVITHSISKDTLNPNYTLDTDVFRDFCNLISNEISAGRLELILL